MITEQSVRDVLSALKPGETLTTRELLARLMPNAVETDRAKAASSLIKAFGNPPTYCTRGEPMPGKAFNKGRMVSPRIWHRVESAELPARPPQRSFGAASPATSLADRLQRIEDYLARRDPLFNVL